MKFLKLVFCFTLLFGFSNSINAQFWKKLKKKVENKIEQKIEKETDKKIDSLLDGKKKKRNDEERPLSEVPKFNGGKGKLILYNHGFEYNSNDASISVYGKFNTKNLSSAVKTYNEDRVIAPVDALPEGYALANGEWGYLNSKGGQITIHHADSTKIVYSLKGTWSTIDGNKPVAASFVSLNVSEIVDKRETNKFLNKDKQVSNKKVSKNNEISDDEARTLMEKVSPTVNIPSTFSFNKTIDIEISDNRGEKYPLQFLLGSYPDIYAISVNAAQMQGQGTVYMVMTPKSSTTFMDMGMMKIRRSSSIDQLGNAGDMANRLPEDGDFAYKKTGNTKTILGYSCEEWKVDYDYTNAKGSASFWVSKDFPIQNKELPMLGMKMNNTNFNGFVLELNSIHQGNTWTMKVVNVQDKSVKINTNEYRKM